MQRDIRIVLVGDPGVGKSTLITWLITETFHASVSPVLPAVTISADVTPEKVRSVIVDTCSSPDKRSSQDLEIRKAHVIALVYSVVDGTSFYRLAEHWLPYIRSLGVNVPIILVGNKTDLLSSPSANADSDELLGIMKDHKSVETCLLSSAKAGLNVAEVFYFCQKAVIHPSAPIYDSRSHCLKPACETALRRIFALCDTDRDGLLTAEDLHVFQRKCFGVPLQAAEMKGLVDIIRNACPGGVDQNDRITEQGFMALHTQFVQQSRLETTWTILRAFGYAEDLSLTESYLRGKFDVPKGSVAELSSAGYQFLTDLFRDFDRDKDGQLSPSELSEVFKVCPGGVGPWGSVDTISNSTPITLNSWLAQWCMTTILDYTLTLRYLAYLGFDALIVPTPTQSRALQVKPKRSRGKKGDRRHVFLGYVFGAAGSGKTALLRALEGKKFAGSDKTYEPTERRIDVVNSVELAGEQKYLVLQEFGAASESFVMRNDKQLEAADVIAFVYDCSDANSFTHITSIRQQYRIDHLPCIFISTKSDKDLVQQRHEVQPDVYTRKLGLSAPVAVSVREGQLADVFQKVLSIGISPSGAIPIIKLSRRARAIQAVQITTVTAAIGIAISLVFRAVMGNAVLGLTFGFSQGTASVLYPWNWKFWHKS